MSFFGWNYPFKINLELFYAIAVIKNFYVKTFKNF